MRQQKVMTFEESWERLFDVFERYYCQHEETDRQRVVRMHEFLSSSSSLGEEFVVRFICRRDRTFEEKLQLAKLAAEDAPTAPYLKLCVSVLDYCLEIQAETRFESGRWSYRRSSMKTIYQPRSF